MQGAPFHYRRNFIAFLGDYVGFAVAMAFANVNTVLPEFVGRLAHNESIPGGASLAEVWVGLFSSLGEGVWLLPQLFFASLLVNKRRKKPYVMLTGIFTRPLYLLYAVALALGLFSPPWPFCSFLGSI
jgi:hypothetical protein